MPRFNKVILLLATALLGTVWIAYSRETAVEDPALGALAEAPQAGHLAPDFTAQLLDGEEVSLSDYRGMPVVLNFWATWCPPCRAEIPHFQEASEEYAGRVAILGLNDGETAETVTPFVDDFGMTYPVLLSSDGQVSRRYRVLALPTTIFINADGVIEEVYPGIINGAVLQTRIEGLLAP